jgi:predicted small lipoprotein YifL
VADKTSFTKEEWTLLLESPMIAGMAITAADPSGLWGLLKESFAGGSALAGCGRKGGLDLPPTASSAAVAAPADTDAEEAGRPSVFNPYYGTEAPPAATKGRKKPFILDPLLND